MKDERCATGRKVTAFHLFNDAGRHNGLLPLEAFEGGQQLQEG
jgi:hypothetical protein